MANWLVKLAMLTVKDKAEEDSAAKSLPGELVSLDERFLGKPGFAMELCRSAAYAMARETKSCIFQALNVLREYRVEEAEQVRKKEQLIDSYEDILGTYLVKLTGQPMSEQDSHELSKYLHMISDLERISDHAVNIMESAQELHEKQISFSQEAQGELAVLTGAIREILANTLTALHKEDLNLAGKVEPLEQVIDALNKTIRSRHIDRLTRGNCTIELGFVLNDILTNLERVSDHCSNLAVAIIEIANNSFDVHEYLSGVKAGQGEYRENYEEYKKKFALQEAHV